jgi:hypothetical protein
VSAESNASQQGQPEQNDLDRALAPPPTDAAQCRRPLVTLRRCLMSCVTHVNPRSARWPCGVSWHTVPHANG